MPYKFTQQSLEQGLYEPEGIYLELPLREEIRLAQLWGSHSNYYSQFQYNGLALKGYIGVGLELKPSMTLYPVDQGRVSEINFEQGGFERYIKIDHRWGESLYACVRNIQVEAGQHVDFETPLAISGGGSTPFTHRFHLGVRIHPYNRYDGWGGFTDPLPYLNAELIQNLPIPSEETLQKEFPIFPMAHETDKMRRP